MYENVVEIARTVRKFCENYEKIGDGHMVEFFARDHYHKSITDVAKSQLMKLTLEQLVRLDISRESPLPDKSEKLEISDNSMVNDIFEFVAEAERCEIFAMKSILLTLAEAKKMLDSTHPQLRGLSDTYPEYLLCNGILTIV